MIRFLAFIFFVLLSSQSFAQVDLNQLPQFRWEKEQDCKKQFAGDLTQNEIMLTMRRISYEQYMQYKIQINQLIIECSRN